MRRRIINLVVAMITVMVPMAAGISPARADVNGDFLATVNSLRASVGRPALSPDPTLGSVAQQWAQHMASTATLAHNPNLTSQVAAGWTKLGENVGYGGSVTAVYDALLASPGHYANMVDPDYNLTGVGIATAPDGTVWLTEDFEAAPTAVPPPPKAASFIRPTNGAKWITTKQPFRWSKVPAATNYRLVVGTARGANDVQDTGVLPGTQQTAAVPSLPAKQTLWARIYTTSGGPWVYSDVTFTTSLHP